MVDSAEFPYRLAPGWISVATLESSDSYLLSKFPLQSDQISLLLNPWGLPDDTLSTWPAYTRYGQNSDTTAWADGPVTFRWGLIFLTEIMQYYFENLIWASDFAVQNAPVTVKTRRAADSNGFAVYQAYATRPRPNVSYKRGVRGVRDYLIDYVGGVKIT